MSDTEYTPDLSALSGTYQIEGQQRCQGPTCDYLARRSEDDRAVIIRVAHSEGDHAALSHFASDAQILGRLRHSNATPVLDSKWTGKNDIAVVYERIRGITLADRLAHNEQFPGPRIAAVLQTISGLLAWARENSVVHRGVTPDNVLFVDESQRVLVMFSPSEITSEGVRDTHADAETIGALASAMLTGDGRAWPKNAAELAERRPDLAARVVAATDAMMHPSRDTNRAPDVDGFIATIAMADVLKKGEDDLAAVQAEQDEYHRKEREAWETELTACRRVAADEAQKLADERAAFVAEMAAQRAAFDTEMAAQRAAFTKRADELRAKFDKEMEDERTEMNSARERLRADRARIEKARAELAQQMAAASGDVPAPEDELEDLDLAVLAARAREADEEIAIEATDERVPERPPVTDDVRIVTAPAVVAPPPNGNVGAPRWAVPTGIVVGLLLIAGIAFGVMRRQHAPDSRMATTPHMTTNVAAGSLDTSLAVSRRAAGADSIVKAYGDSAAKSDSVTRADSAARADSTAAAERRAAARERAAEEQKAQERAAREKARKDSISRATVVRPDTLIPPDTLRLR